MLHRSLSGRARGKLRTIIGAVTVVAAVLASAAWTPAASPSVPSPSPMTAQAWNTAISQLATPGKGCFTAAYPRLAWQGVACVEAPSRPYAPKMSGPGTGPAGGAGSGTGPAIVGNGVDYSAGVTGVMNAAQGSFPTVSGVTSESGGGVPNTYSLQLNAKPFVSPVCAGHPLCKGWEQFLYSNQGFVFIQFWLLQFNAACPVGWNTFPVGSDIYCWANGASAAVTPQPITNLANLSLKGTVSGGVGGTDTALMSTTGPSGPFVTAATSDSVLDLSADWAAVEFAIVGDGGGSSANFNPGATIVVQTVVHNGTTNAPICLYEGYTGETNNLSLVGTAPVATGASPYIQSEQSDVLPGPSSCASAQGWGDTHIVTFDGVHYDNQYRGQVIDVQSPTMNVQANQVSGAPSWPAMAVNNAVATQMGPDKVALCQSRLVVDGATTPIADGQKINLLSGVTITRTGTVYVVTDPAGDSMQATVWSGPTFHIDLVTGLGTYPENVSGLFANAPGNVNQLRTSTGTLLNTPLDFNTMYNTYVPSWRVQPANSLLSVCDTSKENASPPAPFWASNLPTDLYQQSRAVCQKDGVRDSTLLDECTLDVGALGDSSVASVYAGMKAPVSIGFK